MSSSRECFVYIVLPVGTEFVTAGRFRWTEDGDGAVGAGSCPDTRRPARPYRVRADIGSGRT